MDVPFAVPFAKVAFRPGVLAKFGDFDWGMGWQGGVGCENWGPERGRGPDGSRGGGDAGGGRAAGGGVVKADEGGEGPGLG